MSKRPSVAVVGGGILGMTAAHRLAQSGVAVTLFERSQDLGGLAGSFDFDGRPVDRFYHVILPTDDRVRRLAVELGLGDCFRFRSTKVGFYSDGRLFSMTSPREFLKFPVLRPLDRIRLAIFVARCQLKDGYEQLDTTPLLDWLKRRSGRRVVENLWAPLLDSKFDGRFDDLPATYIWARTRRMSTTRNRSGAEVMGWLEGGYQTLIDALERGICERGGAIQRGTTVEQIVGAGGSASGVMVDGHFRPFDLVLCTLAPPLAQGLLSPDLRRLAPPDDCRYLGVVCLLLRTTRSFSPYYHLNITDRRIPLTTIVETTHVVDPAHVGGHLLYISKYVDPSNALLERTDEDIAAEFLGYTRTIFPDLRDEHILASSVQRARITEPVHVLGGTRNPDMFGVPGLALASTSHVYPALVSGQAMTGVAEDVVPGILERLPGLRRVAA